MRSTIRVAKLKTGAVRFRLTLSEEDAMSLVDAASAMALACQDVGGLPPKQHDDADKLGILLAEICREWMDDNEEYVR